MHSSHSRVKCVDPKSGTHPHEDGGGGGSERSAPSRRTYSIGTP